MAGPLEKSGRELASDQPEARSKGRPDNRSSDELSRWGRPETCLIAFMDRRRLGDGNAESGKRWTWGRALKISAVAVLAGSQTLICCALLRDETIRGWQATVPRVFVRSRSKQPRGPTLPPRVRLALDPDGPHGRRRYRPGRLKGRRGPTRLGSRNRGEAGGQRRLPTSLGLAWGRAMA